MDYLEYKNASERHLETCLRLRDVVIATYSKTTLNASEEKKRNELLANIYYLSGFIIECIVSYGILKYIDFDSIRTTNGFFHVEDLQSSDKDAANRNFGVSYGFRDPGCRWSIYNAGHQLSKNLTFFSIEAGLTGLGIRGVDVPLTGDLRKMLNGWNVKTRYEIISSKISNQGKVFDFLLLAEHIHIELYNQSQNF